MTSKEKQNKIRKVMREYKAGKLTSNGKKITDPKQAMAIALSEAGIKKEDGWMKKMMDKSPAYMEGWMEGYCGEEEEEEEMDGSCYGKKKKM